MQRKLISDRNFYLNLERESLNKLNQVQNNLGDNYDLEDMDIDSPKPTNDAKSLTNLYQPANYFNDSNSKSQPLSQNNNFNNRFASEFAQATAFAAMFNPSLMQTWFNHAKQFQNNQPLMNYNVEFNNMMPNKQNTKSTDATALMSINVSNAQFQPQVKNYMF